MNKQIAEAQKWVTEAHKRKAGIDKRNADKTLYKAHMLFQPEDDES